MYATHLRLLALILVLAACRGHHYGTPKTKSTSRLYVEISPEGSRDDALRAGAEAGLAKISFAVPVDDDGDVELQVELAQLAVVGRQTLCKVKILVLRLPTHDLLGIADGAAQVRGTSDDVGDDCIESLGASLIRGKVRSLLKRRLDDKR